MWCELLHKIEEGGTVMDNCTHILRLVAWVSRHFRHCRKVMLPGRMYRVAFRCTVRCNCSLVRACQDGYGICYFGWWYSDRCLSVLSASLMDTGLFWWSRASFWTTYKCPAQFCFVCLRRQWTFYVFHPPSRFKSRDVTWCGGAVTL
jgi:hypothetical protein